jgi:ankyrin repeat protein
VDILGLKPSFRILCIFSIIAVLLSGILCARKTEECAPRVAESGKIPCFNENSRCIDSLDPKSRQVYVVTRDVWFNTYPNELIIRLSTLSRTAEKGELVWKIVDSVKGAGDGTLVPIYHMMYGGGRKFWTYGSAITPVTNLEVLAGIITTPGAATVLLRDACSARRPELVKWALDHGAVAWNNAAGGFEREPLYIAANNGPPEIYSLLDPRCTTSVVGSASILDYVRFRGALNFSDLSVLKRFIADSGRTLITPPDYGHSMVSYAMARKQYEALGYLLDTIGKLQPQRLKEELLCEAAEAGDTVAFAMLASRFDKALVRSVFTRAAPRAAGTGNLGAVQYLLRFGEKNNVRHMDSVYWKVFNGAVSNADSVMAAQMIVKGVNVDKEENSSSIEYLAGCCRAGTERRASDKAVLSTARLLIENGAEINKQQSVEERTALHYAAEAGNYELVEYLLSHGAAVNALVRIFQKKYSEDYERVIKTPLMLALEKGNATIAELLIKAGARLSDTGYNALSSACRSNNLPLFKMLVKQGAKVDSAHLLRAAYYGSDSIVAYIAAHYPGLDCRFSVTHDSGTRIEKKVEGSVFSAALYGAGSQNETEYMKGPDRFQRIISALVKSGKRVTDPAKTVDGTAVSLTEMAAEAGRFDLVNYLLEMGAPFSDAVVTCAFRLPDPRRAVTYIDKWEEKIAGKVPCRVLGLAVSSAQSLLYWHGIDSATVRGLERRFRQQAADAVPQLKQEALDRILSFRGKTIDVGAVMRYLMNRLKEYQASEDKCSWFSEETVGDDGYVNCRMWIPSNIVGIPVVLNRFQSGFPWFRHYNPHLINAIADAVGNKALARVIGEFGSFQTDLEAGSSIPSMAHEMVREYERLMRSDSARQEIAVYESYFRRPFEGFSPLKSFSRSRNPKVTAFWVRRMFDGSADAFINLFRRIAALFPEYGGADETEGEYDETGEVGGGEQGVEDEGEIGHERRY